MCESVIGTGYGEIVKIMTPDGEEKSGQVFSVPSGALDRCAALRQQDSRVDPR